jgi:hypothetical protein
MASRLASFAKSIHIPGISSLELVSQVTPLFAAILLISFVMSALFTFLSAIYDMKFGGRFKDTYISVFVLQTFLMILLAIRGFKTEKGKSMFSFKAGWLQSVMIMHATLPNLLLTGIWVTRTVIERIVVLPANAHFFVGKDFTFLTIAMVSSNVFSSLVFSVLFANTSFFSDLVDKTEGSSA